jgi:biopolymer transport protein ExbB/TolQ
MSVEYIGWEPDENKAFAKNELRNTFKSQILSNTNKISVLFLGLFLALAITVHGLFMASAGVILFLILVRSLRLYINYKNCLEAVKNRAVISTHMNFQVTG